MGATRKISCYDTSDTSRFSCQRCVALMPLMLDSGGHRESSRVRYRVCIPHRRERPTRDGLNTRCGIGLIRRAGTGAAAIRHHTCGDPGMFPIMLTVLENHTGMAKSGSASDGLSGMIRWRSPRWDIALGRARVSYITPAWTHTARLSFVRALHRCSHDSTAPSLANGVSHLTAPVLTVASTAGCPSLAPVHIGVAIGTPAVNTQTWCCLVFAPARPSVDHRPRAAAMGWERRADRARGAAIQASRECATTRRPRRHQHV